MGLFDKILGSKDVEKLEKEEAFAAISLAAIAADGYISDEEAQSIAVDLTKRKFFEKYNAKQINSMFQKLIKIIKNQGIEALVEKSRESLPSDLRETAFAVAIDLALADGYLDKSEKDVLSRIQQHLGISDDVATKIIDVILIKNKS